VDSKKSFIGALAIVTLMVSMSLAAAAQNNGWGPGPVPPANARAFGSMEKTSAWFQCSSADCSGGGVAGTYWVAPYQTNPSLDGSSTVFSIAGNAYSDDLFGAHPGVDPNATHYIMDWNVMTDANAPTAAQALEFDFIQVANGLKFNFSSECNYATGTWDTWNEPNMSWIHTSVPCTKLTPNVWHHFRWYYERVGSQTHYISLTVDGVTYPIPDAYTYQPAPPTNWANGALVFQVQQDLSATPGGGFKEWINKAALYTW
jgi:hypothetical protein